ncbi:hypothetical protein ACG2F4_05740 [Halalkalibaculum sp. DA3122]|uniref:hypothetical protein n=1 Tax=unclassified Halalkalibaculum TaxID=2964617 RepID=UPI0037552A6B
MHKDPKISDPAPPGTYAEDIILPCEDSGRQIELAIFNDHRYSFFYWLKWTRKLQNGWNTPPPTLVTIDWHRDLAPPSEAEKRMLNDLHQQNLQTVVEFTTNGLDPHNDGQILSAAWLNLVGDIILLKNYGMEQQDVWPDQLDNAHQILEFRDPSRFQSEIVSRDNERFFLDIDLDYFIKNKVAPYQREKVELYGDEEIKSLIDPNSRLFIFLQERLEGITLATEPRYCGGIRNSNHILDIILNQLFTPEMRWNHEPG